MRITKRQLRRIIKEEFAPTAAEEAAKVNFDLGDVPGEPGSLSEDPAYWEKFGVFTGEDLAISLVADTYSDMYKAIHKVRPQGVFDTYKEVKAALEDLEQYYEDMIEADMADLASQREYEAAAEELAALMPTHLEKKYDKMPTKSGMRRRYESINCLRHDIRAILSESLAR